MRESSETYYVKVLPLVEDRAPRGERLVPQSQAESRGPAAPQWMTIVEDEEPRTAQALRGVAPRVLPEVEDKAKGTA